MELYGYIERIIGESPARMREKVTAADGRRLKQRLMYADLAAMLRAFTEKKSADRYLVMPGLRGTGKSTLLAELYITATTELGIDKRDILYIDAGEVVHRLGSSIQDVLQAYETYLSDSLITRKTRIVLIDEAHMDPRWAITLKSLYERTPHVFIAATGSSASALRTGPYIGADTARRARYERIFPLRFREFTMLCHGVEPRDGLGTEIARALFQSPDAQSAHAALQAVWNDASAYWLSVPEFALERYLTVGSFPFSATLEEREAHSRLIAMIDDVVRKDLPGVSTLDSATLAKIPSLLRVLATMEDVNNHTILSQNLLGSSVTEPTLLKMLQACRDAEIIASIPEIGAQKTAIRNTAPRHVFTAPAMKAAYRWLVGRLEKTNDTYGHLLEDAALLTFWRGEHLRCIDAIGRRRAKSEADFVIHRTDGALIACEIGFGQKQPDQAQRTVDSVGCTYGLTVSRNKLEIHGNVVMVPLEMFLCI